MRLAICWQGSSNGSILELCSLVRMDMDQDLIDSFLTFGICSSVGPTSQFEPGFGQETHDLGKSTIVATTSEEVVPTGN